MKQAEIRMEQAKHTSHDHEMKCIEITNQCEQQQQQITQLQQQLATLQESVTSSR